MDSFVKQVKSESSKLVDINSVLMKLNDKGYIDQMAKLFNNIFYDEQNYTVQELTRLMQNLSSDKFFDMNMQFKMNTSIFKANFDAIIGIIINNIWNKITEDNVNNIKQQQPQQDNEAPQQNIQQEQQKQVKEQQQQQQEVEPQQQQQVRPSQKKVQSQNLNTNNSIVNNSAIQYQNNSLMATNQNDSWVRQQIRANQSGIVNRSAMDNLYDGKNSKYLKNTDISLSQLSGRKKGQSNLQNTSKISISSVRSVGSMSKLGPVPFSEISGIHDQSHYRSQSPGLNSSFSRAPRDIDRPNNDTSPGPSDYNLNKSLNHIKRKSPNTKFDKSQRISFIDEKLRYDSSVQTPGAIYDPTKKFISNGPKKRK